MLEGFSNAPRVPELRKRLIFTAVAVEPHHARPLDAVAGIEWRAVADVDPDDLAFPSLRMGWEKLVRK